MRVTVDFFLEKHEIMGPLKLGGCEWIVILSSECA